MIIIDTSLRAFRLVTDQSFLGFRTSASVQILERYNILYKLYSLDNFKTCPEVEVTFSTSLEFDVIEKAAPKIFVFLFLHSCDL